MDSQANLILQHMRSCGGITQRTAIEKFGCYRLSARIHELREQGHTIITNSRTTKNRYGKNVVFAEYVLLREVNYENQTEKTASV